MLAGNSLPSEFLNKKRGVAGEYWKLHTAEEREENRTNSGKKTMENAKKTEALNRSMLHGISLVATASAANENDNR